jgi:endoglucanase
MGLAVGASVARVGVCVIAAALSLVLASSAMAAVNGNPMAGVNWFVDPGSAAAQAARNAALSGDPAAAARFQLIAATPQATWFIAADDPLASGYVDEWAARWSASGATAAPIVLHGLPHQDCQGDNAPGHQTVLDYKGWIDHWAQWIGGKRVTVFLEPDALAASSCLSRQLQNERFDMMSYAAKQLSQLPRTAVYEDIGASDWLSVTTAARLLKRAGIRYARGFSLDVTHYDWTVKQITYGRKLSRKVGGKHFVVNTSGNGLGPELSPPRPHQNRYHYWCNPRGRALGPLPTSQTPSPLVDAFFWINNPGLSDGTCNGGPTVGTFWAQWALELATNSARAPDYPAYRAGH